MNWRKELSKYFERARKEGWAIGQFNIGSAETLKAVAQAAARLKSPVIVGTSEGESRFLGIKTAAALVAAAREETGSRLFLNLDHGASLEYIKEAIETGYDTVHFDGSKLDLEENIQITKDVVKYAGKKGVLVEGEVGFIKGSSRVLEEMPEVKKEDLTDPAEAERFMKETKVDRLAVNVGTFHGMTTKGSPNINFERMQEIKERVGNVPLVLHGGSGVSPEEIKRAIQTGAAKINVNTELRAAYTQTLKRVLDESRGEVASYKYMSPVIEAVQKVVEEKIILFGSNDKI